MLEMNLNCVSNLGAKSLKLPLGTEENAAMDVHSHEVFTDRNEIAEHVVRVHLSITGQPTIQVRKEAERRADRSADNQIDLFPRVVQIEDVCRIKIVREPIHIALKADLGIGRGTPSNLGEGTSSKSESLMPR